MIGSTALEMFTEILKAATCITNTYSSTCIKKCQNHESLCLGCLRLQVTEDKERSLP